MNNSFTEYLITQLSFYLERKGAKFSPHEQIPVEWEMGDAKFSWMERRISVGTGQSIIGVYYLIYHLISTPPKALFDFIPNTLHTSGTIETP